MRILIVEDDTKIASFIQKGLEQAGYAVDHVGDGESGLDMAILNPYDAAVVDIMLPVMDGLSLIEEMRRRHIETPVIILSAKRSVDDRIKGLKAGGDDYLTKPFSFSELLVRVQALLRRASKSPSPVKFSADDLHMVADDAAGGGFERFLTGPHVALALPAVKVGAVVGQDHGDVSLHVHAFYGAAARRPIGAVSRSRQNTFAYKLRADDRFSKEGLPNGR